PYQRHGAKRQREHAERPPERPGTITGVVMATLSQEQRKGLQKQGRAMPPSSTNQSDSPRFPIKTRKGKSNSLEAAIKAVGRAKPNTDEERAKVRRYIMRVAGRNGWSADIPSTWNSDGSIGG